MSDIAKLYLGGNKGGWAGKGRPGLVKDQFNLLSGGFRAFGVQSKTRDSKGQKMMLYDVVRKLLGHDTDNYGQEIGDCISFGAKNAVEYLMASEKLMKGDREKWAPIFPPYLYGTGRVLVGKGQLDGEDGSLGSWMADAVIKYGVLRSDFKGVPVYSGKVASKWGDRPGPDKKFIEEGKLHPVKSAALIESWEDLRDAIVNGYPCTTASDIGYDMEPSNDGFHRQTDEWGHQMCGLPHLMIKSLLPKRLDQISVGDKVFGKSGNLCNVSKIYKNKFNGKISKIYGRGILPVEVTHNHPVLVVRDSSSVEVYHSIDQELVANSMVANKTKKICWVNAEDVREGDYLVCPSLNFKTKINPLPKWKIKKGTRNKLNDLYLDDDIAWFFGLYIADGGATKSHKITVTLGRNQIEEINRCVLAIEKLGLNSTVKYYEKFVRINAYSSVLADTMTEWFGKGKEKHIPEWMFGGWDLKEVIDGLFVGDGNSVKNNTSIKRIVNTSSILIDQIHSILLSMGEKPYITKRNHKSDYAKNWNDIYVVEWTENSKKLKYNYWEGNNYLVKVHKTESYEYSGFVYNLEVDGDHSYIANGIVTHNCIVGVDDGYKNGSDPYAIILNSWGDCHGSLKDFDTGEKLPVGVLRVRRKDIEKHIRQEETFAYSNFDGFPEQLIDKALFMLV